MRYESEPEDAEDFVGFAIEGEWRPNRTAEKLLSERRSAWRDTLAQKLITLYSDMWVRRNNRGSTKCDYMDLLLLELSGGANEPKIGPTTTGPVLLIGVHKSCGYGIADFARTARRLGFRESDYLDGQQLGRIVDKARSPYVAPCTFAAESLKGMGYKVTVP